MDTDRLVDFVCVRETHQVQPSAPLVSIDRGALMLCPRGETLGHVWRAAANAPFIDDRAVARRNPGRGAVARISLRVN